VAAALQQCGAGYGRSGVVMRAPGDRRTSVRYEVFGAFWGTFDAGESVRVHDLTPYGALIEAFQPLAVESIQSVCFVIDGQQANADARVRHVRAGPEPDRYLVGLEFIATSTEFLDVVDRLMRHRARFTEPA
jgi:hypothetical protein